MAWTHLSVTRVRKWASDWLITLADSISDLVITSAADANILQYNGTNWVNDNKLRLQEIADPGFATADEAWLHAEDVAGFTQIHHNTSDHKWTIGQDNWLVARNTSGGAIGAAKAVYITGTTGTRPEIAMADADLHHAAIGLTTISTSNNGYTPVVLAGYVKDVDTSAWAAGTLLYVSSTAGDLTSTPPSHPASKLLVAAVVSQHAVNGILLVVRAVDSRNSDGTWSPTFTVGDNSTAGELRLVEPSGAQYSAFKTQTQAGNVTYTLPAADGSANQLLSTNGSGTLSWATAASGGFSAPQGRLTLVTGTPVMSSEQAAKTTIYYTPYQGDKIPLYDGSAWSMTTFTELSLAMASSANWAANSNYDLYVYNDGGTLRLGTGAAWTSDTARNESLAMLNGILTNNASMTLRYAASSTVTAAANRATYVGTMRTTANTGETTWELGGDAAGGNPVLLYLWNCYNRVPLQARCSDSTVSWTYGTNAWRNVNASASNRVSFVRGLNEDAIDVLYFVFVDTAAAARAADIGVALDASTGQAGNVNEVYSAAGQLQISGFAPYQGLPGLGFHYCQAVENATSGANVTFWGNGTYSCHITFNGVV